MLEQIGRMRGHAPWEQQPGRDETIKRGSQLRLRLAHHRGEQGMRKLATDYCRDLGQLLCRAAEPVEPGHERGIEARRHTQCWRRNRSNCARSGDLASCLQYSLGHLLYEQRNTVGTLDDVLPNACR